MSGCQHADTLAPTHQYLHTEHKYRIQMHKYSFTTLLMSCSLHQYLYLIPILIIIPIHRKCWNKNLMFIKRVWAQNLRCADVNFAHSWSWLNSAQTNIAFWICICAELCKDVRLSKCKIQPKGEAVLCAPSGHLELMSCLRKIVSKWKVGELAGHLFYHCY